MTDPTPPRARTRVVDMAGAIGVVLLLVGAVALITFRSGSQDDGVRVVAYETELDAARASAPYAVVAPVGLDGYRATSVRYTATDDGTIWHLGFFTPLKEYVGVDQTDGDPVAFVDDLTEGAEPVEDADVVTLGGRTWQRLDGAGDAQGEQVRGLVTEVDGATTLVSGTADWPELEAIAAALETGG